MSLRRRTLLFVLTFLSGNFVSSQIAPGKSPVPAETLSNFRGSTPPYSTTSDLLSAAQRLLAKQLRICNDYNPPPIAAESPPIPIEPVYQELPIEINPSPNFPISNNPPPYNTPYPLPTPEFVATVPLSTGPPFTVLSKSPQFLAPPSLPISPTFPLSPPLPLSPQSPLAPQLPISPQLPPSPLIQFPSQLPLTSPHSIPPLLPISQLGPIYQSQYDCLEANYQNPLIVESVFPIGPSQPLCTGPQQLPEVRHETYGQYVDTLQYLQSPNSVQVSSMPVTSPYYGVATPCPSILPQELSLENFIPNIIPNFFTQVFAELFTDCHPEIHSEPVVETPIIEKSPIVKTIPEIVVSNLDPAIVAEPASVINQPLPVSLLINMPSPPEQPIIMISTPTAAPIQEYNLPPCPPPVPPPPPVIIKQRSRSNSLRNLLPILLIAMSDGGCQNGGYGGVNNCGCTTTNIPIPYPIPIPINNPVICSRSKSNAINDSVDDDDEDDDSN